MSLPLYSIGGSSQKTTLIQGEGTRVHLSIGRVSKKLGPCLKLFQCLRLIRCSGVLIFFYFPSPLHSHFSPSSSFSSLLLLFLFFSLFLLLRVLLLVLKLIAAHFFSLLNGRKHLELERNVKVGETLREREREHGISTYLSI